MAVKASSTTEKYVDRQMNLLETEEWRECFLAIRGTDVYCPTSGKVRTEWLSDCAKERVLTIDLLEEVVTLSNLERACQRVISNGGSAGVDKMLTEELSKWFSENWRELQESLRSGRYRPAPVLMVEIPKANGGTRQLGIPTVKDRVIQQAIHQVLSPRYERIFSDSSYGFRPERSTHQALQKSSNLISQGNGWIVDIDLAKFFDTVNHQRLLWTLSRRIGDKRLLKLIRDIVQSGILAGGLVNQRVTGTPQGGPLSPLLSNIVLDEMDKELECRGHQFVRYADDLRIFLRSKKSAQRVMESVSNYIEARLRLQVNRDKSKVCKGTQTNFLGYSFLNNGTLILSKTSERRFRDGMKKITSRRRGISPEQLLKEINQKLRGWLNYFRYAQMKGRIATLVGWIQRRIRCFRLKQCKRAIGIVRFLKKLGVPEWRCWLVALSGKGWWRLSSTPQVNEAMNNKWFEGTGLLDMKKEYSRLQFEETAVYVSTHGGVRGQ